MKRQVFSYAEITFDETFKQMAVALSNAKGSVTLTGQLHNWRRKYSAVGNKSPD